MAAFRGLLRFARFGDFFDYGRNFPSCCVFFFSTDPPPIFLLSPLSSFPSSLPPVSILLLLRCPPFFRLSAFHSFLLSLSPASSFFLPLLTSPLVGLPYPPPFYKIPFTSTRFWCCNCSTWNSRYVAVVRSTDYPMAAIVFFSCCRKRLACRLPITRPSPFLVRSTWNECFFNRGIFRIKRPPPLFYCRSVPRGTLNAVAIVASALPPGRICPMSCKKGDARISSTSFCDFIVNCWGNYSTIVHQPYLSSARPC